ncbi:MAG: M12 family metallo-peptidase [Flavobacteriaceae bacterium]|nr:M12 family metallo-peptidase [Flavobacteriaceae bacterium]
MKKNLTIFFTFFILLFSLPFFAQQKNIWNKIDKVNLSDELLQQTNNIKKAQTFHLKLNDLKMNLKLVPSQQYNVNDDGITMQFPDKNGKMITFLVKEAPVMHPDLAKQFPNNKSYKGVALDDPTLKIRFSVNEKGLHAMIIDKFNQIQYIDPISKNLENYRVYGRKNMDSNIDFQCFTENIKTLKKSSASLKLKVANDKKLRTYRLALAATGEYSQYHIDLVGGNGGTDTEKKAIVLAAMTTAMTRINAVFENDLAITMQIVASNSDIIYLDGTTDPYDNDDGSAMLTQNQTTCDNIIGTNDYDIGHVFSTGGGGIASLAVVCTNSKARGVTGAPNPTGDHFYFDFVAHEFGHQFGANHTFNGDAGNCVGSNRNDPTAVEPGSGSTLMAYASFCSPQNVQNHSDLYFHVVSIDEILANITTGNSTCGVATDLTTNLFVPTVNAGNDFIIPIATPYKLVGQGADGDNDPISFCWEQIDNEITNIPPNEMALSGALYRSINPKINGERYLPDLLTVVNGNISSKWEVTPAVARDINFKLTVRDNNTEAGQVASDDLKITVTDAAGPFIVTSQNEDNLVWDQNPTETITWDVAGTIANGVNVSNVNILLSTDGGITFSTISSNTPNDGTQDIMVPDTEASKCFVMVEAIGNFFYAINSKTFSIGQFNEVCTVYDALDTPLSIPDNDINGIVSSISVPDNYIVEKIKVSVQINHTYISDLNLTLESPQGTIIDLIGGACDEGVDMDVVFDDNGIDLVCGASAPVISGVIKPVQVFYGLIGEMSLGSWKLKVVDNAEADNGSIESWSIELCTSEIIVLGVNNYVFDDFNVYPNPSNGEFNIEFNSKNSNDVEITIFDLLGRKIMQKTYITSVNSFKETLIVRQITKGLYILRVKRGNEISSQKIQIN